MKKNIYFILVCCFLGLKAFSQESIVADIDENLLTKYIGLAKQNFPRIQSFKAREEKARYVANAAKMSWFDVINAGYYYRPETSTGNGSIVGGAVTTNGQLITSGFMFGATINFGNLLSKPSMIKAAKADHKATVAESAEYSITLVNEVKSRYYDFLAAKKQLAIRNTAAQSLRALLTDAQQKYERGEIAIDVYTVSKNAATESEALALIAEVAYLKAKNALEDMIGAKLETVK